MRGRTTRGAEKLSRSSASPGTIKRYMTQGGREEKDLPEENPNIKERSLMPSGKTGKAANSTTSPPTTTNKALPGTNESEDESEEIGRKIKEKDMLIVSKLEIAEMFAKLESTLKNDISGLRCDLGHLMGRLEEAETKVETQEYEIKELKGEIETLQKAQRDLAYKMEDQENRDRRKNLRIRGIVEIAETEDLTEIIQEIFNPVLGRTEGEKLSIERVHRIRKPPGIPIEVPRDVIVRFQNFQEKEQIWRGIRGGRVPKYKDNNLTVFTDLSKETLDRRRQLKPLLEELRQKEIKYNWGFPACLIARKNNKTARLKFPEETTEFCNNLGIPVVGIRTGKDGTGNRTTKEEQWHRVGGRGRQEAERRL